MAAVRFLLNGEVVEAKGVDPTRTLLEHLRGDLRRTGTKEGCAEGDCGSCTVLVGELDAGGATAWRAVNSCIQFVPMLDGKAVITVEGLAQKGLKGDEPHPVQAAMVVALGDDAHVAAQKELYRARRAELKPALEAAGFTIDRSEAGLYLWATEGRDGWDSMDRLAALGILAGPGVFYGEHHPQHVRLSLTATDERIASAAARLRASGS